MYPSDPRPSTLNRAEAEAKSSRSAIGEPPTLPTFTQAADAPPDRLWSIADVAAYLNCSRRAVERLKTAGKLPQPDGRIGRLPRWKPATIRAWIDMQAKGRTVPR